MKVKKTRNSVQVKEQAVLRLLRGEDLEMVGRETGIPLHDLSAWRDKYMRSGREGLKSNPKDLHDAELEQRDQLIARQALEIEILKKARAFAAGRKPSNA